MWGWFNAKMNECFFVNLNEMSKKETEGAKGKIKGLIQMMTRYRIKYT